MIRLTQIVKHQSGPVRLRFNTGDRIEAPRRVVKQLDVEEGESYSLMDLRDRLEKLSRDILPQVSRNHLSQYTKTSTEYIAHFKRKGYSESLIKTVLVQLKNEGYIDDEAVARRHVERRLEKKYYGRYKLMAELKDKGLSDSRAQEILSEYYPPKKEKEKAREYAKKNRDLDERKLVSRLKNRGFSRELIGDVINNLKNST